MTPQELRKAAQSYRRAAQTLDDVATALDGLATLTKETRVAFDRLPVLVDEKADTPIEVGR